MGLTQKQFILYEGALAQDAAKMNMLNIIKIPLNELEKGIVSYTNEGFTIGKRTFRYDALQTLEIADLYAKHGKGNEVVKYIRIKGKDGKDYVLVSSQGANDRTPYMSGRAVELLEHMNEARAKSPQVTGQVPKKLRPEKIDKIWKMLSVTTRIKMDMMQKTLGLDVDTFNNKIFDWAAEFHFKIDGDFVVIEGGDVTGFITKLEDEFAD